MAYLHRGVRQKARYSYNGNRFASLDAVIENASGKPFRQLLAENILEKIGMTDSVPGQDALGQKGLLAVVGRAVAKRYEASLLRIAKPYTLYGKDELILTGYPFRRISTSAGLVSTVTDLAKYDVALDRQAPTWWSPERASISLAVCPHWGPPPTSSAPEAHSCASD